MPQNGSGVRHPPPDGGGAGGGGAGGPENLIDQFGATFGQVVTVPQSDSTLQSVHRVGIVADHTMTDAACHRCLYGDV